VKTDDDVTHRGEKCEPVGGDGRYYSCGDGKRSMMIERIFERDNWVKMYRCVYI